MAKEEEQTQTRSYEGSFCVYVFSLIPCYILYNNLSIYGFIYLLLIYPVLSVLIEGCSPHTLDAGFLEGFVWLSCYICIDIL